MNKLKTVLEVSRFIEKDAIRAVKNICFLHNAKMSYESEGGFFMVSVRLTIEHEDIETLKKIQRKLEELGKTEF